MSDDNVMLLQAGRPRARLPDDAGLPHDGPAPAGPGGAAADAGDRLHQERPVRADVEPSHLGRGALPSTPRPPPRARAHGAPGCSLR